ncbi:beta strand repeat-containing protein [Bryocella elongata]|uniref:beta strand repeat-containing protein n=1 Tax=Bryocella elongata TaxID=863522 RepID=UPI00135788BA|nr:choice-of-anchor Q domain-containing protein [Bryocella elongata]
MDRPQSRARRTLLALAATLAMAFTAGNVAQAQTVVQTTLANLYTALGTAPNGAVIQITTSGTMAFSAISFTRSHTIENVSGGAVVLVGSNLGIINSSVTWSGINFQGVTSSTEPVFSIGGSSASLTLIDCSIYGNNDVGSNGGTGSGAAIFTGGGTTVTLINTTITGNSAPGGLGGGILNGGKLTVINSTITGNSASGAGSGGGIISSGTVTLINSIVSGNTAGSYNDVDGTYTDGGGNVVGQTATQIGLQSLNYYANGITQTMPPATGSTAIGAGVYQTGEQTTDQNGTLRPNVPGAAIDSGAVQVSPILQLVVSNATDATATTPNCVTLASSGNCSLRDALGQAAASADTFAEITFDPAVFTTAQTIKLNSVLAASKSLSITGPTALVTISGQNSTPVMTVASGNIVGLTGLTIANGQSSGNGAGVNSAGTLVVTNSTFANNASSGIGNGGGIYSSGPSLTVIGSTFVANTSTGGGAIYSSSPATISNSTFNDNAGNSVGGAIFATGNTLSIQNSTFNANSGTAGGAFRFNGATLTVNNSILSGDTGSTAAECYAPSATCPTNGSNGNVVGVAAKLANLLWYGGPTETMPPLAGSPALNAGTYVSGEATTDQRGAARPASGTIDAGAVQVTGDAPMVGRVIYNTGPTTGGTSVAVSGTGLDAGTLTALNLGGNSYTAGTGSGTYAVVAATSTSPAELSTTTVAGSAGTTDTTVTYTAGTGYAAGTSPASFEDEFTYYVPVAISPAAGTLSLTKGASYSQAFTVAGGSGSYTYSHTGTLPTGVTLSLASGGNGWVLSGTPTVTGPFSLGLTATDAANVALSDTENYTISVAASSSPATHFAVTATSSQTAGSAFTYTVTAETAANATATSYSGTVQFTSSDSNAVLPANATLTNGVGTFNATLKTSGSQSLTATDTVTSSITGSTSFSVTSGAPASLVVVSLNNPVPYWTGSSFVVTAYDAFGNVATTDNDALTMTSPATHFGAPAPFVLNQGTVEQNLAIGNSGQQTVTATDAATGLSGSVIVTVAQGWAQNFSVSAPASTYLGQTTPYTVVALNLFNDPTTAYSGTVHFTSSDGSATLPADATITNGTGTFTAALGTVGSQTISATDTVTSSITGTSGSIAVSIPNLVVNTTADHAATASNCTPQTSSGTNSTDTACALRDAIAYAQSNGYSSTITGSGNITFDSTVFNAAKAINLLSSLSTLQLGSNTTITGATTGTGGGVTNLVTVNGNNNAGNTVFTIPSNILNVALNNLTITGGNTTLNGSGIANSGSLTLSNSTVTGNNVTVSSGAKGAGIYNTGTLTLINSTVSGNTITGGGNGAGIWTSGPLVVENSTVAGNRISANGNGAGVYGNALVAINDSTISGNTIGGSGSGAGIFSASQLNLGNTIVAGNSAQGDSEVAGAYTNQGGNQIGTAVTLAPLGNYGGPTRTMLPLPGSTAICSGSSGQVPGGISGDQRGDVFNPLCTSGAVDAGAVQTNYALAFSTQPSSVNAGSAMAPAPVVTVTESGVTLSAGSPSVSVTDAANDLSTTPATASASQGVATFSNLIFTRGAAANTLTATVPLTNSIHLTAQSNSFNVTIPVTVTANFLGAATTLAQGASTGFAVGIANTNGSPVSAVVVNVTLPSGLQVVANSMTQSCAATVSYSPSSTAIAISGVALATGGSCEVYVTLAATASGTQTVSAAATVAGTVLPAVAASVAVSAATPSVFILNADSTLLSLSDSAVSAGTFGTSSGSATALGLAVDSSGDLWGVLSSNIIIARTKAGVTLPVAGASLAGLYLPTALAIDGSGRVWIANGNSTLSVLNNDGSAATGQTPVASAAAISTPASLTIDSAGSVWIANQGSNTVTEVIGAATPVVAPLANAVSSATVGARP